MGLYTVSGHRGNFRSLKFLLFRTHGLEYNQCIIEYNGYNLINKKKKMCSHALSLGTVFFAHIFIFSVIHFYLNVPHKVVNILFQELSDIAMNAVFDLYICLRLKLWVKIGS